MEPVVSLIDSPEALEPHLRAWDALAVAAGRPYCAPAWALAWWRHAAPPGADLRVLVMTEADEVVAMAPFFAVGSAIGPVYRLLASDISPRVEPLAVSGREAEAAHAFAGALAAADPRPAAVVFKEVPRDSVWPELLRERWPGSAPRVLREGMVVAPTIGLEGRGFDGFLAALPSKRRGKLRRDRRQLEERGARYRLAGTPDEVARGLAEFARLHYERWDPRGGSAALNPRVEQMLEDVSSELLEEGRFRLYTIDVGEETITAQLFVTAGGEVTYWLGGFDLDWSRYGPGNQAIVAALEEAAERGEQRLDLGPGEQDYKRRMADGEDVLESVTLVTRPSRYPLVRAQHGARRARGWLSERLPESVKHPLRGRR